MQGTREIERFNSKRGKFQFKFRDKPRGDRKVKKPLREKPEHKRWY